MGPIDGWLFSGVAFKEALAFVVLYYRWMGHLLPKALLAGRYTAVHV